jgi:hypothetical protein
MPLYTHEQLIEYATLTPDDLAQVDLCRRPPNRLGFAYQIAFVRLTNRFPAQQPLVWLFSSLKKRVSDCSPGGTPEVTCRGRHLDAMSRKTVMAAPVRCNGSIDKVCRMSFYGFDSLR